MRRADDGTARSAATGVRLPGCAARGSRREPLSEAPADDASDRREDPSAGRLRAARVATHCADRRAVCAVDSCGGPMTALLEARQLEFAYPGAPPAVRGVSLSVTPRSMTAVIGANGSGKSTLIRLL